MISFSKLKLENVGSMDLFDDVTQNCDFLYFSLKQKLISMKRFIVPNLVKFQENPLQVEIHFTPRHP